MVSRVLALLFILPSFAFGLLVASGAFAPPESSSCATAAAAAAFVWFVAAAASVCVPALLCAIRGMLQRPGDDLWRLAGLALGGHAALVIVGILRAAASSF